MITDRKKVFVNGTFDVLHPGHIELLKFAADLAKCRVTVGIDSDRRVRELKGPGRPFFNEAERILMLSSLIYVRRVLVFDTDDGLKTMVMALDPDIMVIGSDWEGKEVVGSEYAGELQFFPRFGDYSTTKILQGLVNR